MTEFQLQPQPTPTEVDEALRTKILVRAKEINGTLLARFATIADDLDARRARAAIGGLDGIEREIQTMRSLLLLFP
jgi:hypothetical protein